MGNGRRGRRERGSVRLLEATSISGDVDDDDLLASARAKHAASSSGSYKAKGRTRWTRRGTGPPPSCRGCRGTAPPPSSGWRRGTAQFGGGFFMQQSTHGGGCRPGGRPCDGYKYNHFDQTCNFFSPKYLYKCHIHFVLFRFFFCKMQKFFRRAIMRWATISIVLAKCKNNFNMNLPVGYM